MVDVVRLFGAVDLERRPVWFLNLDARATDRRSNSGADRSPDTCSNPATDTTSSAAGSAEEATDRAAAEQFTEHPTAVAPDLVLDVLEVDHCLFEVVGPLAGPAVLAACTPTLTPTTTAAACSLGRRRPTVCNPDLGRADLGLDLLASVSQLTRGNLDRELCFSIETHSLGRVAA